ncbi:phosphatidylglycerol:prolipoprotein diacylglycerol transferase [Enterococcus sp. PF1-24]|uniref:prolipoprotein diacylglyceryl transferase n=1 Tax=unclassified Enterococcus TaxID=2608891 RepID=UPI0024745BD2|nr:MULTISPECIES: prolipoprotein diacylglyceryl transferase [unclassified Enterococcus]MDH6363346.1 phosphatidylglycerol:prolipoprotein diacylglycerol transferase [Enterococcus sp. PFB1-1]MDH6400353.1 phosphatidylglycerol:prolipoprotein diacylglycerol transferase [Enterococcus sp. PF1-24]
MFLTTINRVAFKLFGLEIYWYAILIVTGIMVAVWLSGREAVRVGLKSDDVGDFMLWGLPIAIVGARLYYILFDLPTYLANPMEVFNIRSGGLAVYGGLIAGAIVIFFFTRYRFISTWTFLDIAAPSVLIAQAFGRWGNFTNHEAYGPETTRSFLEKLQLPNFIVDNMYIDGAYRQPTFLYESVWCVLGFILILFLRKKSGFFKEGEVFLSYLIWYGLGRFFIEGLRTDSLYIFGILRVSQLLSLLLFVSGIALVVYRRKKNKSLKDYNRTYGNDQKII